MVTWMEELTEAVTKKLLQRHSRDEYVQNTKNVIAGIFKKETVTKYPRLKKRFRELSVKDGAILRCDRVLIQEELE